MSNLIQPNTSNARPHIAEPMEVDMEGNHVHEISASRPNKRRRLEMCDGCDEFVEIRRAFNGMLRTFYLKNSDSANKDINLFLDNVRNKIKRLVENILVDFGALKFNLVLECTYVKPIAEETQARAFKTKSRRVLQESILDHKLERMFQKICREESEYMDKGSGWTLHSIDGLMVRLNRYRPLRGSTFIPLPDKIVNKRAIINPMNIEDNKCFQWAILARHVKGDNKFRVNHRYYNLQNKYNFDGITFPTPLSKITIFEKRNPGVSVNVYGLDSNEDVYPVRVCKKEAKEHFDLLLFSNEVGINHYCYITDFSRLVRSQLTRKCRTAVFCKRCFKHFQGSKRNQLLKKHKKDCCTNKPVKVVMPCNSDDEDEPKMLGFSNFHFKYKVPIVAYCDFESILMKPNPETKVQLSKNVTVKEIHEPMSFCVYLAIDNTSLPDDIVNSLPNEPYLYRGEDASSKLVEYLIYLANLTYFLTNLIYFLIIDKLS